MKIEHDASTDSLYISLRDEASVASEEVAHDIVLDYDATGHLVGIDIQHASQHTDIKKINSEGVA